MGPDTEPTLDTRRKLTCPQCGKEMRIVTILGSSFNPLDTVDDAIAGIKGRIAYWLTRTDMDTSTLVANLEFALFLVEDIKLRLVGTIVKLSEVK